MKGSESDNTMLSDGEKTGTGRGSWFGAVRRLTGARLGSLSRSSQLICLCSLFLIFGIWSIYFYQIQRDYDSAIEENSRDTMNLVKAFEEHVRSVIVNADGDIIIIKNACELSDGSDFLTTYFSLARHNFTQSVISVIDEQGGVVISTSQNTQYANFAHRDYFPFHRDNPGNTLHIGNPVAGTLTGLNVIPLTRRINKGDGSFGGVVFIGLRTDYFTEFYGVMDIGEDNLISVTNLNGIVLARQVRDNLASGQNVTAGELQRRARIQPNGTFIARSAVDGIERIRSYRLLDDYPLIVSVGISMDTALRYYVEQKRINILIALLSNLFIIGMAALLVVRTERNLRERNNYEREILYLANHDALTGLPTLRLVHDRLTMALGMARRHQRMFAVMFLDLDNFKAANDAFGHAAGDELLRHIAQVLTRAVRETDTVGRVGGDEFILIIGEIRTRHDAAVVAAKLIKAVNQPVLINGHSVTMGASIGIALYPADTEDSKGLIERADRAMYESKRMGKNRYSFIDAVM